MGGGRGQKSQKMGDVIYGGGRPLTFIRLHDFDKFIAMYLQFLTFCAYTS